FSLTLIDTLDTLVVSKIDCVCVFVCKYKLFVLYTAIQ
ncbi:hypothetical protein LSH36_556g02032, partial [Paralvinella palmiformis]